METVTLQQIAIFAAFILPGFISMRVYALLHPISQISLKDQLFEAIAYSIVNLALNSWALFVLLDAQWVLGNIFWATIVVVWSLFLAPILWPIAAHRLIRWTSRRGWILSQFKTTWDDYFLRREPSWLILHLKDGRRVGGWFGERSAASLHPFSGHLYVEELWELNEDAKFLQKIPNSRGAIFRPEDYQFVEFIAASATVEKEHGNEPKTTG